MNGVETINVERDRRPLVSSSIVSGLQLKAARVMAGLTQAQLSTEAGFNPRAAKYWESRGEKPPTSVASTLLAIETVLRRYGVELFVSPTPGCRFISTK
jgi:DNA-binding transcriptional regulator YiaG